MEVSVSNSRVGRVRMGSPGVSRSTTLVVQWISVVTSFAALSPSVSPGVWRWHHNYWLSHSEVIHNNPSPDELHTSAGEATVIVQRFVPC